MNCYGCNENIGPSKEFGVVTCMHQVKRLQQLHEYVEDNDLQGL